MLNTDSRITGDVGLTSAVGWEQGFHNVSASLICAGWRLLRPAAWTMCLIAGFLVDIAGLVSGFNCRTGDRQAVESLLGGLALVNLVLIWHEPGSPQYVWLNILAATALIKVLPQGRFLILIRCIVMFLAGVNHDNTAFYGGAGAHRLYPQLEKPGKASLCRFPVWRYGWEGGEAPVAQAMSEMKEGVKEIDAIPLFLIALCLSGHSRRF